MHLQEDSSFIFCTTSSQFSQVSMNSNKVFTLPFLETKLLAAWVKTNLVFEVDTRYIQVRKDMSFFIFIFNWLEINKLEGYVWFFVTCGLS